MKDNLISSTGTLVNLQQYKKELEDELHDLLVYWQQYTTDDEFGGFKGQIDGNNLVHPFAPKGAVLNTRILWTFSAAFRHTQKPGYLQVACRAFDYFINHFIDKENGGIFWSVDHTGKPLDTIKKSYAAGFGIYSLCEYYLCNPEEKVKQLAIELYQLLLKHAYDKPHGGFTEAFSANWQPVDDLRLSDKDANTPKSMNTHLHLLEAFTNLYRVWPDENLKWHMEQLLNHFEDHIINQQTGHLHLFFDKDWTVTGDSIISFGHDIEAAWLLLEAATITGTESITKRIKQSAVDLSKAASKGLDTDGGLWYETDRAYQHWIYEKHWWPQAEAMVGFFNAWQLTGEEDYLNKSAGCWSFIKRKLKDPRGEWYWGIDKSDKLINKDKAGFWKCPYHNSRACMELINRIQSCGAGDEKKNFT